MVAAIASAALIVAGSLVVGHAILSLCGRRFEWLAAPVGLALILTVAAITASAGGRGGPVAAALGALLAGSVIATLLVGRARDAQRSGREAKEAVLPPLVSATLAAAFAALPFIAAGAVGVLGVGLVNDDMASHLLIADWIEERFRPEPVFIDQGYPLGPHALASGLSSVLGASTIDVFAGLVLALPAITALVAYSALGGLPTGWRAGAAALVAVPYMAAAYLAQEAFKEPLIALFLLAFALLVPRARRPIDGVPLAVLAAGSVYVYSFPGLAWLAGFGAVWALALIAARRSGGGAGPAETTSRPTAPRTGRPVGGLAVLGVGVAVFAALVAPELPRLLDFRDFRALDPDRANEGGLGNLPGQISPLTAFGIWPTGEFRLSAAASSLPAALFYAGGLFAICAFAVALPRWVRRHGWAIPAALVAAAVLYVAARAFGTVYTSAKALAIAAPLIMLVTLGGLLGRESPPPGVSKRRSLRGPPAPAFARRAPLVLAAVFALAAAGSSFLILRQAPVGPDDHRGELAEIRPLVAGEKLLFLGRDNFVLHSLRGSKPFTHVRNFYDPYFVEPNFELAEVGSKFDFDSVTARTLARFPYVLTTRAAYASGPPPGYEPAKLTESYVLWRRGEADPSARAPVERGAAPGRELRCDEPPGGPRARAAAFLTSPPVLAPAPAWTETTIESGESASIALDLPGGRHLVSLRYDSTRPLRLSVSSPARPGPVPLAELPGNLDYRGTAPFWAAGEIDAGRGGEVVITAAVEGPPLAGRLLGARSVAHLGDLAATSAAGSGSAEAPSPGSGGRLASDPSAGELCGRYADWVER